LGFEAALTAPALAAYLESPDDLKEIAIQDIRDAVKDEADAEDGPNRTTWIYVAAGGDGTSESQSGASPSSPLAR
jgi:hypothetical protein